MASNLAILGKLVMDPLCTVLAAAPKGCPDMGE